MADLSSREDSGVLVNRSLLVHRDSGSGYAVCGMTLIDPQPISDAEVVIANLARCNRCYRVRECDR